MKAIIVIVLLSLASIQVDAKSRGMTLNQAVTEAKSQGRVLSARTINGKHEIKVLTTNGTVKTIHKRASRSSNFAQNNSDHSSPQTWHNRFKNEPQRSERYNSNQNNGRNYNRSNNRNVMRIEPRSSRPRPNSNNYTKRQSTGREVQRTPRRSRSSSNSKDNDN